jgi:hypothetical protein
MTVRHVVRLPRGAEPWVTVGQSVEPGDVVATRRPPGEATGVPLGRRMGIRSNAVEAAIAVRPGTLLAAGDLLASRGRREVRAPSASLFLGWDPEGDSALVAPLGPPTPIHAHVRGSVVRVEPREVEIAAHGVAVDGIGGTGDVVHGPLVIAVRAPSDELRASAIDVGASGRIVVGGSRTSAETLIRARAMGVAGIVLAGLLDKELRDFEALQKRRREVGSANDSFGVLLVEGYGKIGFDPSLFAWFQRQDGRMATLFGSERRLYVYDADPAPLRRSPARSGERVIAHRRPFAGRTGVVVRELEGLHAAASGIAARTALVRFDDGRVVAIPLANLEAIEAAEAPAGA